jgi:DNA-binding NarL/FixJ family response regulator
MACEEYGFDRGLVLSVGNGQLTADATDALSDEASDRLRRQMLASPVDLRPDTPEAELVRLLRSSRRAHATTPSPLANVLQLEHHALGVIAPESRALAILVVDRATPTVEAADRAAIDAFGDLVAGALEYVVLRARLRELAGDLRHLTASTQALMREILEAPVMLPLTDGERPAFPLSGPISADSEDRLRELLSESEARIASLLVQGLSNREIADELILSPETVKAHVARILRKLGASNRVEAVSLILRVGAPSGSS